MKIKLTAKDVIEHGSVHEYRVRDLRDLDGIESQISAERWNAVIHLEGPGSYSLNDDGEFVKGVCGTYCRLLLDHYQFIDDDGYIRCRLGLVESMPSSI